MKIAKDAQGSAVFDYVPHIHDVWRTLASIFLLLMTITTSHLFKR